MAITSTNTHAGTLTIDAGKTVQLGDGTTDGWWAGTITGAGTLVTYNAGTIAVNSLGASTGLRHTGQGTLNVNLADASTYAGAIVLSGGGTLNLNNGAFTNAGHSLTVVHGTLTGADNAKNIHIDAGAGMTSAAIVDLRDLASTADIKSLTTSTGSSVVRLSSSLTLGTADLMLDSSNLSANGSNAVVVFDNATDTLTLDTLTLRITGPDNAD